MGWGGLFSVVAQAITKIPLKSYILEAAKWIATKSIISVVFIAGLSILLNNFIIGFVDDWINAVNTEIGTGNALQAASIQVQGVAAYLAIKLRLPESLSVLISGYAVAAVRSFIPFLG